MISQGTKMQHLDNLNKDQFEAVTTIEGPLLVLAGAGTGKTKVLTTRISHILNLRNAFPSQILAVTFTNKAAKEMKHRVETLNGIAVEGLWLGTFHAIAAKVLRRHAKEVGLNQDFTIIDMDDQLRLIKQIFNDFNIDTEKHSPKLFLYQIGRLKDKAITHNKVSHNDSYFYGSKSLSELYAEYQNRLKNLNAADFGDLLLYNIELFNNNLEILSEYQRKFKYILVDEYQDTNVSQYLWLRLLAQQHNNICCVGDDDQSIYGWRGAEITNILKFDKDFLGAKVIRLQQNYRSTNHILGAATKLISFNRERHGKILWTDQQHGEKIRLNSFYDDKEEARYIADEIDSLKRFHSLPYSDIAILLRAGYQTRSFEESLNYQRIPYRIIGGMKFYERAEIKDTIAYIRALVNPNDSLAFERIINTPKRGIGAASLQNIHISAREKNISLFAAVKMLLNVGQLKGKAGQSLAELMQQFGRWTETLKTLSHTETVDLMLNESGYIDMWKTEATEEARERLDNVRELIRSLEEYSSLSEFLEHVSLVSDLDSIVNENVVNIMTMHGAKGLEFKAVFLPGWEEGIFPSSRSIEESGQLGLEEERRLAYVGITRSKEKLYISFANNRRIYGNYQYNQPSRFIDELPKEHFEIINSFGSLKPQFKKEEAFDCSLPSFLSSSASNSDRLRRGQRVFHKKFGYGIILSITDDNAQVEFEKTSTKKVLLDYLEVS
ncbi:UvrD-helicase domain-containing protein [Holosporaceae bacterium 'Namur']|nr:UvrD-helicase domain-containing protein [Holosporaceae bacterium 'Namur']